MGYVSEFYGEFKLNKTLKSKIFKFLKNLSTSRRFKRNVDTQFGVEGEFFVGDGSYLSY